MQPFQGKKLKKPPHRASSQQTDDVLSRLAGTRLPDEPEIWAGTTGRREINDSFRKVARLFLLIFVPKLFRLKRSVL
jgi:hypothetical protein